VGTAVAILVVSAASLILLRTGQGDVADPPTEATPTTTAPPPTTIVVSPESWNPILATTTAAMAPPAAECPTGSSPEVPGPVDQLRPVPRFGRNLVLAFDHRLGQVVYVDDSGATWLFDVCTNTWHQSDSDGPPFLPAGQLVYDVDSDVTISVGFERVSIYDANTNTWDERDIELAGVGPLGAVYDPVSGLIITSGMSRADAEIWELWAYDVDTNDWTLLGPVTIDRDTPCCTQIDLLGYSMVLDRLILTTYIGDTAATLLVDPRSGEMEIHPATDAPVVDLVWPGHTYGTGDGTVQVYIERESSVCWFDAETRTWLCRTGPPDTLEASFGVSAIVGDPINNRLLLIHGLHGDSSTDATDSVWAMDLATGEWNQVLAPSQP
jgi:hypothetical protein